MADSCLYQMCKFLEKWNEITEGKTLKSASQVRAFLELNRERGITTGEVARKIGVTQSAMYTTVKNLEKLTLGKKQQDPFDAKSYIFIPSDKGKEILEILE